MVLIFVNWKSKNKKMFTINPVKHEFFPNVFPSLGKYFAVKIKVIT